MTREIAVTMDQIGCRSAEAFIAAVSERVRLG